MNERYVCDTKDYVTGPNDFSIISREQIIGSIHANKGTSKSLTLFKSLITEVIDILKCCMNLCRTYFSITQGTI